MLQVLADQLHMAGQSPCGGIRSWYKSVPVSIDCKPLDPVFCCMPNLCQPQDDKMTAALRGKNQGIKLMRKVCITQQSVWCQKRKLLQEIVNFQTINHRLHAEVQVWIRHRN